MSVTSSSIKSILSKDSNGTGELHFSNYSVDVNGNSNSGISKIIMQHNVTDTNRLLKFQIDDSSKLELESNHIKIYTSTDISGNLLIGDFGTTYNSGLHVENSDENTGISKPYSYLSNSGVVNITGTGNITASLSISSNKDIYIKNGILRVSSDRRIKKDIVELNDNECLEAIRTIGLKKYKYIDPISRGTDQYVRGFIAQDVSNIIPNSVKITNNYIPNIYNSGDASLISSNNNTNIYNIVSINNIILEKQQDLTKILLYDDENNRIETILKEQINANTISIETKETLSSKVFMYGEEIYDFNILDKNAIYTTAIGALQELDRKEQINKDEIQLLKSNYEDIITRLTVLENK